MHVNVTTDSPGIRAARLTQSKAEIEKGRDRVRCEGFRTSGIEDIREKIQKISGPLCRTVELKRPGRAFFAYQSEIKMAMDPDRPGEMIRKRSDWGAIKILALIALFACFSLWFYFRDKEMVSGDGTVVKSAPVLPTAPPSPRDPDVRINPAVKPPANR